MEEHVEMVGRAFVDHYYHLFDNDRASLPSLYHPTSILTFEGQKVVGVDDISSKLNQLPFDQCRHMVSTIDSQPSACTGGSLSNTQIHWLHTQFLMRRIKISYNFFKIVDSQIMLI
jgi:hypothetical protein